jgi:hypothetical protein
VPRPVICVINDYPDINDKNALTRQAKDEIENGEGLVATDLFFIPPIGLVDKTQDISLLHSRIRQFNNPVKIGFTPGAFRVAQGDRCLLELLKESMICIILEPICSD